MKSQLILISGPSSSGKSTLAQAVYHSLDKKRTRLLALDNYYRDLRHLSPAERAKRNFDEPNAWESERLLREMQHLIAGHHIHRPRYDFNTHLRVDSTQIIEPAPLIIAEGIFALCYPALNEIATLRIFVDIDDEPPLQRRLERDISARGRTQECITQQFNATVRPANRKHIRPCCRNAHLVLNGCESTVSQLKLIQQYLHQIRT